MLNLLADLDPAIATIDRNAACARITGLPAWRQAGLVLAFAPRHDELDLCPLWDAGSAKRLLAPRMTHHDPPTLIAADAPTPPPMGQDDSPGWHRVRYDIWEPLGDPVDLTQIDLALIPGLAFTPDGRRLGRGKGFYDRFLPRLRPDCCKCGIGYDFQIVDELPIEAHDILLDAVVTPSDVYRRTDSQSRA